MFLQVMSLNTYLLFPKEPKSLRYYRNGLYSEGVNDSYNISN